MKKAVSVLTIICILFTTMFCTCLSVSVFAAESDLIFENAKPIECGETYNVTVDGNGDYLLSSFTAPETGYYLFEALGIREFVFPNKYYVHEPVITLYDCDKNEIQYVEFDYYDPEIKENIPYSKAVQKLEEGETCYFKTNLLNSDETGKYLIRAKKAPDFVFTYVGYDIESGYYELYEYTGTSKELIIDKYYTVSEDDSLLESPYNNIPLEIVGLYSFEGNEYLESLTVSDGITCIASGAFLNCKNLNTVNLGKDIDTIGYRAFAGCDSLKTITIKSDNVKIEYQALGYDENGNKYSDLTIICHENSTAAAYAEENGINTIFIDEPITTIGTDKTSQTAISLNKTTAAKSISTSANTQVKKPTVKKATLKKVKKLQRKKCLKVKWKKLNNVSGYQIKCGLNKKMTKGKKVVLTKTNCKSKILKGLKSKRKYYVKIRAFKTYKSSSGKTLKAYGKWSNIKKSKTK